ncbi:MAG: hypothetical protein QM773_06225 [Hyphomonadaceae bacterium]
MNQVLFVAILYAPLALGACASTYPAYAPAPAHSAHAAGYREQQIERDHWRVSYTGTNKMSPEDVHDYALMRAAQLALEHGASWFEVVSSDADTQLKNDYTRQVDFTPNYAVQRSCGLLTCTDQVSPVMMRTESERIETRAIHNQMLEIRFGAADKQKPTRAYDAQDTFATLKARLA